MITTEEAVRHAFTASPFGLGCLEIEKIKFPKVSAKLEGRFEAAKQALKAQGRSVDETLLFHGTRMQNHYAILENGLKSTPPGTDKGTTFGRGVYLHAAPFVAAPYCEGDNKLLVCRVLLGRTTHNSADLQSSAREVGHNEYDAYNLLGMTCVRTSEQVLPVAVVSFKVDGQAALQKLEIKKLYDWMM